MVHDELCELLRRQAGEVHELHEVCTLGLLLELVHIEHAATTPMLLALNEADANESTLVGLGVRQDHSFDGLTTFLTVAQMRA